MPLIEIWISLAETNAFCHNIMLPYLMYLICDKLQNPQWSTTMFAKQRYKFAVYHWQWWLLHMSEIFSKGTKNNIKTQPILYKHYTGTNLLYMYIIPWEGARVCVGAMLIQGAATILWTIRYTRFGVLAGHSWAISPRVNRWRITKSSSRTPATMKRNNILI